MISIKLESNFFDIALRHGCSPVNLLHIFRTSFPRNSSGWLLLIFMTSPCSNYWCHQISSLFTFQTFAFKPFMDVWILHLRQRVAAQKMKFSIKDFTSQSDQIRRYLWIGSHLLKKPLMENFIFCALCKKCPLFRVYQNRIFS